MLWRCALLLAIVAIASPARADDAAWWWLSGELDVVGAAQPGFTSPYAGSNSLQAGDHAAGAALATISAGAVATSTTAIVVSGQLIAGDELSNGKGLGAPIDDIYVRNALAGAIPFVGSAFVDQIIPLSASRAAQTRDALHLLRALPSRRLELRAGRLWAPDWFDDDPGGFSNAAIRHDGAWDYPADDRGYALGLVIEYADRYVHARLGEFAMTTTPRGDTYDTHVNEDRNEVAEVAVHTCIAGWPGTANLGGFVNHAQLGDYAEAIAVYDNMIISTLDVAQFRAAGSLHDGVFGGYDQQIAGMVRAFVGFSASNGDFESFGTNEIDNSVRFGGRLRGELWHRPADDVGLGFATNGLASIHRLYLDLGGDTTRLGDGHLDYSRENLVELYYAARVVRDLDASLHVEVVDHPGYNNERGPATIALVRIAARI
ncbi:MAG TPA: carbohydrate porin [Kofleriaceae bacterium]